MMNDEKLLFSPWFRIIVNKWVLGNDSNDNKGWWDDLDVTMKTDTFVDVKNVLCFDPPKEHMGGGGDAGPMFGDGTATATTTTTSKSQDVIIGDAT
jgi:hypothetical protein